MGTILDLVGNTPLTEITKVINKPGVKVYGKLEGQNPGGSVKDRAAYGMIKGALDRGELKPGVRLVEATSGNTGIALAMIAQLFGLKITLIMPEGATAERIQTMKAYGAEVILTPREKTIEYSREYAEQLVQEGGYFTLNQLGMPITGACTIAPPGPKYGRIPKVKSPILFPLWGQRVPLWGFHAT